MKIVVPIGTRSIVLVSPDEDETIEIDDITRIDHSNLYGELVTCSALLNKVGMIKAEAQSVYEETKLSCSIYEAKLRKKLRRKAAKNGGKITTDDGTTTIKLTENSLEELIFLDPSYQSKQEDLIEAKKNMEMVDSLYWAIQSKDKKLNNILPKIVPEEFIDQLVEGKVNTFIIKKFS